MIRMTLYLMELVTLLFLISTCYSHDLSLVSEMKGTSNRKIQDHFFFFGFKKYVWCDLHVHLLRS